jgi:CheY-like chemotaxis protein
MTAATGQWRETPLRVLVVDDSEHFRVAAKGLLEIIPRIAEVSTVASGEAALDLLAAERFDLVILDLSMNGVSGLEVARQLRGRADAPRIVMVSLYDEPEFRAAARTAGVDEFLNKPDLAGEIDALLLRLFGVEA